MNLSDTIAIATSAGAVLGGFLGFLAPFRAWRDLLDDAQRGAFAGAYFGSLVGALIGLAGT